MSRFRYQFTLVFIALMFLGLIAKLFYFQVLKKSELEVDRTRFERKIPISRGEIVDRNDKILAVDMNKYTLEFNPVKSLEDKEKLFNELQKIIGLKNRNLISANRSITLAHNLDKRQADQIRKLNSKYLYLRRVRSRIYPQGELASHVLGYVDLYGKARQGIEFEYEDFLQEHSSASLQLSLDSRLQNYAQKVLAQRMEETDAKKGAVIVMKVTTGELLAWAVKPDFDPNKYFNYDSSFRNNWSLVDVYQPGSVFKIMTVSSALDSMTIDRFYTYEDEGFIKVDNWKIKNHDYHPKKTKKEKLNLQGLFARSSNPFSAHLALKMGPDIFYKYIRAFGFGSKTGVEISGETNGIVRPAQKWRNSDTATTGIGQGMISVTPLQVLTAVNTVANNGYKVKPTLFKVSDYSSIEKEAVILEENAAFIRRLLTNAIKYNVEERHAISGNVPGLSIAGKTGTAQKIKAGGGYSHRDTIASFVGFFPADNPLYTVLVVIDDPKTDGRWGDTVAGPVFNKVAAYIKSLYL
jgi:cell division protein FtsI/penicillin-binding protein 2